MAESPDRRAAGIRARDVLGEAWRATRGRLDRTLLTALGVALGICAAIATLSLSVSAGSALSDRFNALEATLVTVKYPATGHPAVPLHPAGAVAEQARSVHGVVGFGFMARADTTPTIGRLPSRHGTDALQDLTLIAAQPAVPQVLASTLVAGRGMDAGMDARHERVALVDTVAAGALGVSAAAGTGQSIYIDNVPFTLLGVFDASDAQLTGAVLVPYSEVNDPILASAAFEPTQLVARTALGAANQVGDELPLALSPADPAGPQALVPPSLDTLKQGVQSDTRALFLGLAAVSLLVGALGVSNTMTVSIVERRVEIGIRRALGARRLPIALQFLSESALIGGVGGTLGALAGVDLTIAVCLVKGWLVVLDPTYLAAGPVLGLCLGAVAGLRPALRATAVQPASAIRGI